MGGKIGIDATAKWASEGYPREWPEIARMSEQVRARVAARWDELGIALEGAARVATQTAAPRRRRLR
jgi:3-polyprenyl-4-hydroxybenzoate decarboxylase